MSEGSVAPDARPWADPDAVPFFTDQECHQQFGAFTAVDNVSLDIYKDEIFCLLGGFGCGISTLSRVLSGIEAVTSGQIIIDGQDQDGVPPHARETNMLFQSYALFSHMSVEKKNCVWPQARRVAQS